MQTKIYFKDKRRKPLETDMVASEIVRKLSEGEDKTTIIENTEGEEIVLRNKDVHQFEGYGEGY
jgi:hypothetical protein